MRTLHSPKCIIHSAYLPRTVPIIKCKYEKKKKMSDFKPFLAKLLQASYDAPMSCLISLLRRIEMKWLAIFLSQ